MDWLDAYGVSTTERAWHLGAPATLTVIMRDLDTDARSHAFLPIEPRPPGDGQSQAIVAVMGANFPHARWKTYNEAKQVASFVDSKHLYLVIYEEHQDVAELPLAQQPLFAA